MNLREAIVYPYRSIPKVLQMVLVLGMVLVALASLHYRGDEIYSYARWGEHQIGDDFILFSIIGGVATVIIAVTWLTGYSLDVIRHVYNGNRSLPAIRFGPNLKNGLIIVISRIVCGILVVAVFGSVYRSLPDSAHVDGAVIMFMIVMFVSLVLEYQVGLARAALEDRPTCACEIWTNLSILIRNLRKSMVFALGLAALGVLYLLPTIAIYRSVPWHTLSRTDSADFIAVLINCLFVLFFLFQHFSSLYLVAQFARRT